jgi:hypothetical protein
VCELPLGVAGEMKWPLLMSFFLLSFYGSEILYRVSTPQIRFFFEKMKIALLSGMARTLIRYVGARTPIGTTSRQLRHFKAIRWFSICDLFEPNQKKYEG